LRGVLTSGRVAVALSAIALFCAVGGGAYAATSRSKSITVCVNHATGGLYQAKTCAKHDKSLSWNHAGRMGKAGARGKTGAAGPAGAVGATGPAGAPGPAGPGAHVISTTAAVGATATGTIAGIWNYTVGCVADSNGGDTVNFNLSGPGTVASTTLVPGSDPQNSGEGPANDVLSFEGGPVNQTLILQGNGIAVQAELIVSGTSPCSVIGSAIPLGS
jgi:hypothetical protein